MDKEHERPDMSEDEAESRVVRLPVLHSSVFVIVSFRQPFP
jgi:hypothetical protein